jgi:hypothetical protein
MFRLNGCGIRPLCLAVITSIILQQTIGMAQSADDQNSSRQPADDQPVAELLQTSQFAEALVRLQDLPESEATPQIRFWRTWALAATGQLQAARSQAKAISNETRTDAAWREHAQQLCRLAALSEQNIQHHAAAIVPAAKQLKHAEALSFRGTYQVDARTRLTADFRMDLQSSDLSISVRRNQTTHIGLRYQNKQLQILSGQDSQIHQYQLKQGLPRFQIVLKKAAVEDDQKYEVMFGLGISNASEPVEPIQIMNSPVINTREGIDELLGYTATRGSFPRGIRTEGDLRVLSWVTPMTDRPEWTENRLAIDDGNRFVTIRLGQINLTRIQYGQRNEIPINNPIWKNQASVKKGALNPVGLLRLIKTLMQTVYELRKPAPRIADRPQDALS